MLRVEQARRDPARLEADLERFLSRFPSSSIRPEAELLLVRTILRRAQAGEDPGAKAFDGAWGTLSALPPSPERTALGRQTALYMAEYGRVSSGVDVFRKLYDENREGDLALDLVPALVRLAALEPDRRPALLDEASTRISEFLKAAPSRLETRGRVCQAWIYRAAGRDEELVRRLAAEIEGAGAAEDRGVLHLERGRALARLGKNRQPEALACLDEAEKLISDPWLRGLALIHEAELFACAGNPECVEVCRRLVSSESPAAPLALLVEGAFELRSSPAQALDRLGRGLALIRRPRLIDPNEFDFASIYAALGTALERLAGPEDLGKAAALLGEVCRLEPRFTRARFDRAGLLLRAGRVEEAADQFLAAATSEGARPEDRDRGIQSAADAWGQAGLHLRAAALYRKFYEIRPAEHGPALFQQAICLRKAGDTEGAIRVFEECLAVGGPKASFAGPALLEKAEVLMSSGRLEEALATYERVLKAREVATSPVREDWAQALLGRGRALLRLGRPGEAGKALREFHERYGEGPTPAPASIAAARLLVSVAIEEKAWKAGLAALRALEEISRRVAAPERAPYQGALREAKLLEGDLQYRLEDYASAAQAYGEAAGAAADPEDRLWGLIGRARSLLRQGQREEAKGDCTAARAILEEKSWTGPGRGYWETALGALLREIR